MNMHPRKKEPPCSVFGDSRLMSPTEQSPTLFQPHRLDQDAGKQCANCTPRTLQTGSRLCGSTRLVSQVFSGYPPGDCSFFPFSFSKKSTQNERSFLNFDQNQFVKISMIRSIQSLCTFASTLFLSAHAGEWNQHRGPFSNNLSDESITSGNWLKSSASIDWKVETPLGFS